MARRIYLYLRFHRKPRWTQYDGVSVVYFSYFAGALCLVSFYPLLYRWALMRYIRQIRQSFAFDLVHAHTAFLDGTAAAAVARQYRVPFVLTEHTGPFSAVSGKLTMRLQTQRAVNRADLVLAVSSYLRCEILTRIKIRDRSRLRVVPNGTNVNFFLEGNSDAGEGGEDETEALALLRSHDLAQLCEWLGPVLEGLVRLAFEAEPNSPITLGSLRESLLDTARRKRYWGATEADPPIRALWVGHFVDVKKVDRLIQAFSIAYRRNPRLRLTLVGSGPTEQAVRDQIVAGGLQLVVRLLPTLPRDGVREQMQRADFLVISSEVETFGVVAIEALSVGKPVLSTRCGGPQDIVSSPMLGILVDNNMEDLAIGLQTMAEQLPTFDTSAIRRHAIARYSFRVISHQIADIYRELLELAPEAGSAASLPRALSAPCR